MVIYSWQILKYLQFRAATLVIVLSIPTIHLLGVFIRINYYASLDFRVLSLLSPFFLFLPGVFSREKFPSRERGDTISSVSAPERKKKTRLAYLPEICREHVDDYAIDQRDSKRRESLEHAWEQQVLRRVHHVVEAHRHRAGHHQRYDWKRSQYRDYFEKELGFAFTHESTKQYIITMRRNWQTWFYILNSKMSLT